MARITIIAAGGCGSNITHTVAKKLEEKGLGTNGVAKIEYLFMDTSEANKQRADDISAPFYKIPNVNVGSKELAGSGGVRATNIQHIKAGVVEFLNNNKILEEDPNHFIILVSSVSGGTGSVVVPLMQKELLHKDVNFITVTVGDNNSLMYCNNTIDGLKSLHSIASAQNKVTSMYYLNNSDFANISDVDDYIFGFILTFAIFTSNKNEDIDNADMAVLCKPHNLRPKIDVPSGLAMLDASSDPKELEVIQKDSYLVSRVLGNGIANTPNINALTNKVGTILNAELLDFLTSKDDPLLPLILVAKTGLLSKTISDLEEIKNKLNKAPEQDKIDLADVNDDGMVL